MTSPIDLLLAASFRSQGELTGLSGFTGTKEVTLKNGYVSSCPKVQTLVDIYDGPRTSQIGGLGSS